MRRILTLLLTLAMVLSVFTVLPVSAATTEKTVTGITVKYAAQGTNTNAAYNTGKIVDGDTSTFGVVGSFWSSSGTNAGKFSNQQILVLDLGAEYKLSEINMTIPNLEDVKNVYQYLPEYVESGSESGSTNTVNTGMGIFASKTVPTVSNITGSNANELSCTLSDSERLITGYNSYKDNSTYKWDANSTAAGLNGADSTSTAYRYITFYKIDRGPLAFAEVTVKAMVEESSTPVTPGGNTVTVEKTLDTLSVASITTAKGDFTPSTGYEAAKAFDGKADTFACLKNLEVYSTSMGYSSKTLFVLDLGASVDISEIRVTGAATSDIKTAVESYSTWDSSKTSPGSFNAGWDMQIGASNVIPTADTLSGDNSTILVEKTSIEDGKTATWTDTASSTNKYRYVWFYEKDARGLAISEITVKANVEVEVEETLVSKNKAVFSTGDSVANDTNGNKDRTYAEMNVNDGSTDTYYASYTYSGTYEYNKTFGGAVIDPSIPNMNGVAEKHFYRDYDMVIDLGESMPISKVELTPYIQNPSNATSVKYTVGVTDDYSTISGMTEITSTEVGYVQGLVDNEKKIFEKNVSGRYVVVNVSNVDENASQILAGVREVSVYGYPVTEGIADKDTSMVKISNMRKSIHSGELSQPHGDFGTDIDIVNDGCNSNGLVLIGAESGKSNYYIVDLGKAYPISAITFRQVNGMSGFNGAEAVKVVATNTEVTSENVSDDSIYTTIAKGNFADGNVTRPMYARITDEPKYRYVGIKGASGTQMPMREFTVWTSDTDATYVALDTASQSGKFYALYYVENAKTVGDCILYAAGYDSNGVLKKIVYTPLNIAPLTSEFTATGFELQGFTASEGIAYAKLFLVKPGSLLTPVAASVRVDF